MYRVTTLPQSASVADAAALHWKEYVMEATEISALMLSTCICGTLVYSDESVFKSFGVSGVFKPIVMGISIAVTTFMIIRSPFGRRSGAHMNPAVTLAFLWLGRVHRWDAAWYIMAHFIGAIAGVLAARQILGLRLSAPSVQYMVTIPGEHGKAITFLGEFLLAAILMATVLYSSNHRRLTHFTPALVAVLTIPFFCPLSFEIRFQCQSGENIFIGTVRGELARRLDLFCGALPGNAFGCSNILQDNWVESRVLRKGLSRQAFRMPIPLSVWAYV